MFALNRIEASIKLEGSDKFERLGELHKASITDLITMDGHTFTNTYQPGNPASMEAATNRLAKIAPNPSPANFRIAAAEARRARRNAKRAREAAKVGA
jgi:hypothetical protein